MQKIERINTRMALIGTGVEEMAEEAISKRVKELNADGWTVSGMVPLSYSPPLGGAPHRMIVAEIALLISK